MERYAANSPLACCQVALSTMDLTRSAWWYRHALGFLPAGERRHREGPAFAAVPGLPEASFDVSCLTGGQEFFQLEMFEFSRPRMRPRASDWRPCDIGYSLIGIGVPDFDATLDTLGRVGGVLLTAPVGELGDRRVCLRDPDGNLLELMENGRRAQLGNGERLPTIASVTISVPDLSKIHELWVEVAGCAVRDSPSLHHPAHERMWGLEGGVRETIELVSGDVVLEFVQYRSPVGRPRPAGYMISDQGILNVALGCTDKHRFDAVYQRALEHGFRGHTEPWTVPGLATVVYLCDSQGLSVELLQVEPEGLERMGFVPNASAATDSGRLGLTRSAGESA